MTRYHIYAHREYGLEHITSIEAESPEVAQDQFCKGCMRNSFDGYVISEDGELTEDKLYEQALRATCSLCVIEGRCVCGELDPLEDEEEPDWYNEEDILP